MKLKNIKLKNLSLKSKNISLNIQYTTSNNYCSCNQLRNLTKGTDSTTIGIELCARLNLKTLAQILLNIVCCLTLHHPLKT